MKAEKTVLEPHVIVNRYIIFVNELLDAGWHVYGEQKPVFMAAPDHYAYGAVKFFEKDGVTHSVCVALHVNPPDAEVSEAFAYAREYELSGTDPEWDSFEKVMHVDINDLDYDVHSKLLLDKYKETAIVDFRDDDDEFLGFKTGNRAVFQTKEGDLITKSVSQSKHTLRVLELDEVASQLKVANNYLHFNHDDYI